MLGSVPFTVATEGCTGAGWELFNPKCFWEHKNYFTRLAKSTVQCSYLQETLRVTKPLCRFISKYFPESLYSILELPSLGDRQDTQRWTRQSILAQVQNTRAKST